MIAAPDKRLLRVHARSVTELLAASALPALLSLWYWRGWAQDVAQPVGELLPGVLLSPSLALTLAVSEYLLILAFLLSVLPVEWWLLSETAGGRKALTPMMRVARRMRVTMHAVTAEAPSADETLLDVGGEPLVKPAVGEATSAPGNQAASDSAGGQQAQSAATPGAAQPAAAGNTPAPEGATQPNAAQPNAAQPNAAQPNAAQPNAAQPDAAQPNAAQPGAPAPAGQTPAELLAEITPEEEDITDLASLTDVSSILNDAFGDSGTVDPLIQAISERLPAVDVYALLMLEYQIYKEMTGKLQPPRRALPSPQRKTAHQTRSQSIARAA